MTSPQWCFACFRLDPVNACLWRSTEAVPLPPKIFAVLHYLVTHPNRLVRKEELLDAVWPETAVTEAVLRVAVGAVRKVLGDTAQMPRFIATVPRRGYRFLVPVAEHTSTAPGSIGLVLPTAPQTPRVEPQDAAAPPPDQGMTPPPVTLSAAEAERRRLTVLCCDLLDFPILAGHLDPEDLREVVRAYRQACVEVMHRFDGSLAHDLGAGMLVYFGYPVAHEDDAQRAVWTGLGILEAVDALALRLALPPGARVAVQLGLHTGLAVVGEMDGFLG
jgi:DNA-binding winged helix-turn-helix (wHTH) protein